MKIKLVIFLFLSFYNIELKAVPKIDSVIFYVAQFEKYKKINSEKAIDFIHKAQRKADDVKKIELILEEGKYYSFNGQNEIANSFFLQASKISKNIKNLNLEAQSYHYIANNYFITNNLGESHKYILKSIDIFRKINDKNNYYRSLSILSSLLEIQGKTKEAKENYLEIINYFKKEKLNNEVVSATINFATLMGKVEGKEKGLQIFNSLLNNYELTAIQESKIHFNIATILYNSNEINNALFHINKAITIAEKNELFNLLIELYSWKGDVFSTKKEFNNSNKYLYKSLELANKFSDLQYQEHIYKSLLKNNIQQKKFDSIVIWIEKIDKIKDSIAKRENISVFKKNEMEKKIELQETNNLNFKSQIEKQAFQKKIMIYTIISIILISALIFLSLSYYNKVTKKDLEIARLKEINLIKINEYEQFEKLKIKDELKMQKREMLTSLLYLRNINMEVKKVIDNIEKTAKKSIITKDDLLNIKEDIIRRNNNQIKTSNYKKKLENTQKKFFTDLLKAHPELTNLDIKILAYLRIGLTTKEIADLQNVTIGAIRKNRYRVRKKLNLDSDKSLEQYLLKF